MQNQNQLTHKGIIYIFNECQGDEECCSQCDIKPPHVTGACNRAPCMSVDRDDGKDGNFKIKGEK